MSEKQFSKEDLASFAAAIVNEMRKPTPPDEKELEAIRVAQEERRATAQSVIEKKKNERYVQEFVCTHEHLTSAGGGSHCVLVHDNGVLGSPGYVLCQKCQGRVRPDEPLMRRLDPEAIFSTQLFNRLLQGCIQSGQEVMG
jgi:hypothetical protein